MRGRIQSGDRDEAMFLRAPASYEGKSSIPADWIPLIRQAHGVETDSDGLPLIDAQIYRYVIFPKNNGDPGLTSIRGIGHYGTQLMPHFKLLSGRLPQPGATKC